jgi:hypothetical protein
MRRNRQFTRSTTPIVNAYRNQKWYPSWVRAGVLKILVPLPDVPVLVFYCHTPPPSPDLETPTTQRDTWPRTHPIARCLGRPRILYMNEGRQRGGEYGSRAIRGAGELGAVWHRVPAAMSGCLFQYVKQANHNWHNATCARSVGMWSEQIRYVGCGGRIRMSLRVFRKDGWV